MPGHRCYTGGVDIPSSTIDGLETPEQGRRSLLGRRFVLVALAGFVAAGLVGAIGGWTRTSSASRDGWSVAVEHAATARAGLDVPWRVTVRHVGGFDRDITLAVTGDYFDIYETQGFLPSPSSETRDGDTLYLTFTPPPGDTFVLAYDAYVQPSSQLGRRGTVRVVQAGQEVVGTDFRTVLFP